MTVMVAGVRWWTTEQACSQLRVDRKVINQWVRRARVAGHVAGVGPGECPRCMAHPAGRPHLDPPVRRLGLAGYVAQQLLDTEAYTAGSPRGGARRAS